MAAGHGHGDDVTEHHHGIVGHALGGGERRPASGVADLPWRDPDGIIDGFPEPPFASQTSRWE